MWVKRCVLPKSQNILVLCLRMNDAERLIGESYWKRTSQANVKPIIDFYIIVLCLTNLLFVGVGCQRIYIALRSTRCLRIVCSSKAIDCRLVGLPTREWPTQTTLAISVKCLVDEMGYVVGFALP